MGTYKDTGLVEIDLSGDTDILDSSSNPDGMVIVIVRTRGQVQCILSRSEDWTASLVIE